MLMILCIYILVLVLQAMTPYLARQTAVFGVFIPEPYTGHPMLVSYKKSYSLTVLSVGVLLFIVQQLFFVQLLSEQMQVYVVLCMMFVLMNVATCCYFIYRRKIFRLKKAEQWEQKVETKHVTDLLLRQQFFILPSVFFIVPMVVTLALMVFTYMNFTTIPAQVPVHWDYKGQADGWVEKSAVTVMILPLVLLSIQFVFFIMNRGLEKSAVRLSVQKTADSAKREMQQRKGGSLYFVLVSYSVTMLLVTLHYLSIISQEETASYIVWLLIGFTILIIGGAVLVAYSQYKMNEQFDGVSTNETMPSDDAYWKLGVFYFNKEDPSFLMPKRFGVGWTLNFANKWAYVMLLILLLPLLLVWLAE